MSKWTHVERQMRDKEHAKTVKQYSDELNHYKEELSRVQQELNVALSLSEEEIIPKPIKIDPEGKSEAMAVALASDWHVEETVTKSSVNGLNQFNLGVADKRIDEFFKGVVRLTEIQRSGVKIDDCLLWLGGDFMSGHIHEELAESNSLSPVEAVIWVRERIANGIETLAKNFQRVLVVTSYGNHGRDTKKSRHSTGAQHSYEWMMYKTLEQQMASDAVLFQVGESYHTIVDVYGKVVRFHHGDGLRYQGGVGGLTIPVEKAISQWNKSPIKADLDCFGHWHTQMQNPKWCSNGSLIGYGAYALSIKASYEPPQQTFFLLDKKRGRTITCPILV